jgi:hypothetical protein
MLMKTNWEKKQGEGVIYIELHDYGLAIGQHDGNMESDSASVCPFEEFLQGRFQDFISNHFGTVVLAEVIAAVQDRLLPHQKTD